MKAYITVKKTREDKPKIRGLWVSNKQGLTYDYIKKVSIEPRLLPVLQRAYKQEAIFYTEKSKAFVWYSSQKIEQLKYYRYFSYERGKAGFKVYIKGLLKVYGGLTIYIKEKQYLIEIWH